MGVLSFDAPASDPFDTSHGIPNKTVYIQIMNSDGQTWSTVKTKTTLDNGPTHDSLTAGLIAVHLTPKAAGVYKYRVKYDGDAQYAPAISNTVTLTVTNVAIS